MMKPYACPQLQDLPENIRAFWEEKQQELGEKLLLFSYTVYVEPVKYPPAEKGGILYLMERHLWFEDFEKPALFFLNKPSKYKKTCLQIPRQAITQVEQLPQSTLYERLRGTPKRRGLLQSILQLINSDPLYIMISGQHESGTSFQHAFRELNDPESWAQTLCL